MKSIKTVIAACMCALAALGAQPLKLTYKPDIEKANAQCRAWRNLVDATMDENFFDFSMDVFKRCKFEEVWEDLGVRPDFNPSSGKAFGRVAKLRRPKTHKDCINFFVVCNNLYAVRKSFKAVASGRGKRRHEAIGTSGAADLADRKGVNAYLYWLDVMEAFLATKCDVRHPKCYRYISGNYTYDGKDEEKTDSGQNE